MTKKKILLDFGLLFLALGFLLIELFSSYKGIVKGFFYTVSCISLFYLFLGSIKGVSKNPKTISKIGYAFLLILSGVLLYFFFRGYIIGLWFILLYSFYLFALGFFWIYSLYALIKNKGSKIRSLKTGVLALVSFLGSLISFLYWIIR